MNTTESKPGGQDLSDLGPQTESSKSRDRDMTELAESLPGAVFQLVSDPDNNIRYTYVSQRAADVLGHSPAEILANPLIPAQLVIPVDSAKLFAGYRDSAKTQEPFSNRVRIQRPDGEIRWIRTYAAPKRRDDEFVWNGYWDDVTEEVGAAERMSASEARLAEITASLPGSAYQMTVSPQGELNLSYVSEGIEELAGISKQEAETDLVKFMGLILDEDRHVVEDSIAKLAGGAEMLNVDYRCRHMQSGEVRWIRARIAARRRPEGDMLCHGFFQDITDIKLLQDELTLARDESRAAERRVSEITDSLPGVVYRMIYEEGKPGRFTDLTDGAQNVYGVSREELLADPSLIKTMMLPEDREMVLQRREEAARQGDPITYDFRIRKPDGQVCWLRSYSAPQEVENGVAWVGYTTDVSVEREAREGAKEAQRRMLEAQALEQAAQQRMQAIFDHTKIGLVMIDEERNFSDANPSLRDLLEIEDEQEFARDFPAFSPDFQPDGRPSMDKALEVIGVAFDQGYKRFDWMHQTRAGELRPCEVALTRVELGGKKQLFATMTDLRERTRYEHELKTAKQMAEAAQERLSTIFNNIGIGVVMVDQQGRFSDPNPALKPLLDLEDENEFAEDFRAFSPEYQPDGMRSEDKAPLMIRAGFEKGQHRFYWMHQTRAGRPRPVEVSLTRVELGGQPIAFATMTDLRERERHEAALKVASERAEAASRAKSDFLANMSHEIRTPMNAIVGLSHLGLGSNEPERLRDYLKKIDTAAKSLLQIINDILDFSKIEAGKLSLESTPFDLYAVLDNLADLLNMRAAEKGLELLFDVEPGLLSQLVGDPLRLGQVLLNLTGNAIKFTEQGQVVVRVKVVQQGRGYAELRFEVSDTGIGLSEDQLGRLFESFTQADTSTTREYGGTGLGLVISQRLVELMDGGIEVHSRPGQGSTFSFHARFDLDTKATRRRATPAGLRGMRVLVVDDNPTAIAILRAHLESFGFAVEAVSSGEEAVALIRAATPHRFGMVLMDWQMPGMGGIEAASAIRELSAPEPAVIIMVTAFGREEVQQEAEQAGLDGFLVKPVNPSLLLDTILTAFGAESDTAPEQALDRAGGPATLVGKSVLLVEDNEINQTVARELLQREGLTVDLAVNGREAVDCVTARDYDLVLMDMQMPVMDGIAATRAIRHLDSLHATVPIVAMTANAMLEDRKRCMDAGMNDHLGKPVDVALLREVLLRWIPVERRRGTAPSPRAPEQAAPRAIGAADFDFATSIRQMAGSTGLWLNLVQRYLATEPAAPALRNALARSDYDAALRQAHTIKGVAGTLGLLALHAVATKLEERLSQGSTEAPPLLDDFEDAEQLARSELVIYRDTIAKNEEG